LPKRLGMIYRPIFFAQQQHRHIPQTKRWKEPGVLSHAAW
jgi:hypothetical protein